MSIFRTAAVSAAVVFGLALSARAQTPTQTDSARGIRDDARHGKVHGQRRMKGERRGMKHERRASMGRRSGHGRFAADLNLTEAQRTRITTIRQKYQPQRVALRDQTQKQMRALRDARQKGDTSSAALAQFRERREQVRQRLLALAEQERSEMREVLTAEQRARWDAATAQRKQKIEGRRERMKNRRGRTGT